MNTVWLRSVMRRYGIPGLLFVAVYLAVYALWKRGGDLARAAMRPACALMIVIVFGSQDMLFVISSRQSAFDSDFLFAIQQSRCQVAIKMLEEGADPNAFYIDRSNCSISRRTALKLAVAADQVPLVEALFRHGAHPDADTEVEALSTASLLEKEDMLRVLLAHGLNINAKSGESSRTALMNIVWNENAVQGVERLLARGADVNQRDASGTTALMLAAPQGSLPLVRLLLAKGADPNLVNARGESALSCARYYHHSEAVTVLLEHGAKEDLSPQAVAPR